MGLNFPAATFGATTFKRILAMRWYTVFIALLLAACSVGPDAEEQEVVARVFDSYLYQSDIEELVPQGVSTEDSAATVQSFVRQWVNQKLLLHTAEKNLPEGRKDVTQQLEDYRTSLIIYEYEKELIRQKLDTNVSQEEVLRYYDANKHNFELRDYILRVIYLKLEKNSPSLDEVHEWFASTEEEDKVHLQDYAQTYAVKYYGDERNWLYLDEVAKEVPIDLDRKEQYLVANQRFEFEDESYLYLLNVLDYQMKDSISPVAFEQYNIRNIILNQRKLSLISEMKNDIFENARKSGDFEMK